VRHDLALRHVGGLAGLLESGDGVRLTRSARRRDAQLDADEEAAVGGDAVGGVLGLDLRHVRQLRRHEADAGEVDEGEQAHAAGGDDKIAEAAPRAPAAAARVHGGGDADGEERRVRVGAQAHDLVVEVRVDVHQARHDQLAGDVQVEAGGVSRQRLGNRGDFALGDGDVALAVDALGRVNHLAAAKDHVVALLHESTSVAEHLETRGREYHRRERTTHRMAHEKHVLTRAGHCCLGLLLIRNVDVQKRNA